MSPRLLHLSPCTLAHAGVPLNCVSSLNASKPSWVVAPLLEKGLAVASLADRREASGYPLHCCCQSERFEVYPSPLAGLSVPM